MEYCQIAFFTQTQFTAGNTRMQFGLIQAAMQHSSHPPNYLVPTYQSEATWLFHQPLFRRLSANPGISDTFQLDGKVYILHGCRVGRSKTISAGMSTELLHTWTTHTELQHTPGSHTHTVTAHTWTTHTELLPTPGPHTHELLPTPGPHTQSYCPHLDHTHTVTAHTWTTHTVTIQTA